MGERFLGIDFSGDASKWSAGCTKSNVWIAGIENARLIYLKRVQELPGDGKPFDRLSQYLGTGEFRAAGIDAPFSIPDGHLPGDRHDGLLLAVAKLPVPAKRPFATGGQLLALANGVRSLEARKPFRETERLCGATARSTLWNGARPGAPFTVAGLSLLAQARAPLWPWANAHGMLVEAFPMAQLKRWKLPYKAYGKAEQRVAREEIVRGLEQRIHLPVSLRGSMLDSPDALDAVVAAFGGMAAASGELQLPSTWRTEGAIAVHD